MINRVDSAPAASGSINRPAAIPTPASPPIPQSISMNCSSMDGSTYEPPTASSYANGSTYRSQTLGTIASDSSPTAHAHSTKTGKLPLAKRLRNYLFASINLGLLCLWAWLMIDLAQTLTIGGKNSTKLYATITAQHRSSFNGSFNVLSFTSLSDTGHHATLGTTGGDWYTADTSFGQYYVVADVTTTGKKRYLAIGGQACTAGNATDLIGMISTRCAEGEGCIEYCLMNESYQPDWQNVLQVSLDTFLLPQFEIETYYRLKNSVGFGTMYLSQTIASIEVKDGGELVLHTTAVGEGRYEGQWWQWPLIVILFMFLAINILVRFFSLKDIAQGIPLGKSQLFVVADLAGGMITSPGVQALSFLALVVMSLHAMVWQDGVYLFEQSLILQLQVSATIAVAATVFFVVLCSGTNLKIYNSGTTICVVSGLVRAFTRDEARTVASDNFHGLRMILGRSCFAWPNTLQSVEFNCNHSDGIGMSGLELFVKVYFSHFTYTVIAVALMEVAIFVVVFLIDCWEVKLPACLKTSNARVQARSSMSNKPRGRMSASTYEASVAMSGAKSSVFCHYWSRPIETTFGKYYTVSSTIEDNQVMWGPLLLTLYMFPLALMLQLALGKKRAVMQVIRMQLYTGVLKDQFRLVPRRFNGITVSKFIETYDYANCNYFINSQPVS